MPKRKKARKPGKRSVAKVGKSKFWPDRCIGFLWGLSGAVTLLFGAFLIGAGLFAADVLKKQALVPAAAAIVVGAVFLAWAVVGILIGRGIARGRRAGLVWAAIFSFSGAAWTAFAILSQKAPMQFQGGFALFDFAYCVARFAGLGPKPR